GDRDDEEGAISKLGRICRHLELGRRSELLAGDLAGVVLALLQLVDTTLANIEANRRQHAAERDGNGQADIAETNDGNLLLFEEAHRRGGEHERIPPSSGGPGSGCQASTQFLVTSCLRRT